MMQSKGKTSDGHSVTIQSNRHYLSDLPENDQQAVLSSLREFNALKEWMYNRGYDAEFLGIGKKPTTAEIHAEACSRFGHDISGYTVRSLSSTTDGLLSSQKELISHHTQNQALSLSNRAGKIAIVSRDLEQKQDFKKALIQFHKVHKKYPAQNEVKVPKCLQSRYPQQEIALAGKKTSITMSPAEFQEKAYLFECWLDQEIKRVRARLHSIEDRQMRTGTRDYNIPQRITFGSLKFYRYKDTKPITPAQREQWHQERDYRRTCRMQISGRHDARYGNFACRYNPETQCLDLDLPGPSAVTLHLENVIFPYRGDLLLNNFHASPADRKSVGYMLELHYDGFGRPYLLIKATITVARNPIPINTENRVMAIDLNWDHIAWCRVNKFGCPEEHGTVPLRTNRKTTGQRKDCIGRAVAEIIGLCESWDLPLVMEDLDFARKKAQMEYGSRKGNRKLSQFAYQQLTQGLWNRADNHGVAVCLIDPSYTSFIGKTKYMKNMKVPIHIAAAYVIGRRGMGLKERVPAYLQKAKGRTKTPCRPWQRLCAVCKDLYQSGFFYSGIQTFQTQKDLKAFVKEHAG